MDQMNEKQINPKASWRTGNIIMNQVDQLQKSIIEMDWGDQNGWKMDEQTNISTRSYPDQKMHEKWVNFMVYWSTYMASLEHIHGFLRCKKQADGPMASWSTHSKCANQNKAMWWKAKM